VKAALLIAFMMIVPPKYNFELHETLEEVRIIREEHLEYVRLSCYTAPEGAHCADGTLAKEGVCSSNKEHIGKLCVLYDENLNPVDAFYCHDVGSNKMLVNGTAVDIYRSSYQRCVDFIKLHGDYAYVRWVDPEE
jgi:hypothetical protein